MPSHSPASRTLTASSPTLEVAPYLLPYVVYVAHTLEELPGFAAWASERFGPQTTGTFAAYHIPLMLVVLLCSLRAMRAGSHGVWVVLTTAFQWQFALNALFHLTTWVVLGDYSPGAVTGAVVSIPATVFYLWWIRRDQRVTPRELAVAIGLGTVIAALAISFLFW